MYAKHCLFLSSLLMVAACGSDGDGTVTVTAYGEAFIEEGIPSEDVEDGWAVDFSRFEVDIRDVRVAGRDVPVTPRVDLAASSAGQGHELGALLVPEGKHRRSSYTIARVAIEGSATKGEGEKRFNWLFESPTRYDQCDTATSVSEGGSATFQITVHADHLLYDSLVADEPRILFQALADADTDADGAVTQSELAAQDIGAYDPGSEGGVGNLWEWLTAQTRTLGHVDGEGHCRAAAQD